jgi:MFS family permease
MFGAAVSFYLLVRGSAAATAEVGSSGTGARLTTAALMFAMVAAELAMPRLLARFGYRFMLALGLLLLGVPAVALAYSRNLAVIVGACMVRGLGFGVAVVLGSALVAALVPPQRRGEGLASRHRRRRAVGRGSAARRVRRAGGVPPVFAGAATALADQCHRRPRGASRPDRGPADGAPAPNGPSVCWPACSPLVRPAWFSGRRWPPAWSSRSCRWRSAVSYQRRRRCSCGPRRQRWPACRWRPARSAGLLVPSVVAAAAGMLAPG